MDMARSTRLVILIKNIYTLWGQKRFLKPVTYFPTNLVYPFTLRVTGIKRGVVPYRERRECLVCPGLPDYLLTHRLRGDPGVLRRCLA